MQYLSIGEVAEREGLSPEALRFYERLGLVFPVGRTKSGYRLYDVETLRRLRFIRMARELGFSLQEIRELLELRIAQPKAEVCRWVQQRVEEKLTTVRRKLEQLHRLEAVLLELLQACQKRQATDPCPLLAALGESATTQGEAS
jgi:DNA-binding transcriptional MerR regulator